MKFRSRWYGTRRAGVLVLVAVLQPMAHASEHVTLRNGFEIDCARREAVGDRVRLYLPGSGQAGDGSYLEVAAGAVVRVETMPDLPPASGIGGVSGAGAGPKERTEATAASNTASRYHSLVTSVSTGRNDGRTGAGTLSGAEMHEMLARVGSAHHIDADLLASVVRAESGGRVAAVSRAGARGLMQLMPGTATELGVADAFVPEQNISGGTAYLDALLKQYHDNVALALAAYNAGPGAVAKWRGVPPYAETRAYVARVIREFNRRKLLVTVRSAGSRE